MMPMDVMAFAGKLSLGNVVAGGTALALLYYVTTAVYCLYFHPLAKFPGPKWPAFSRLPMFKATVAGNIWQYYDKLHAEYGPIVRIAPDELTTTSSAAWKDIYTTQPFLEKDPYSQTPPINNANSLFTANGEEHSRLRRTFISAFSDKALRDQSALIQSYAHSLVLRLRREIPKSSNGEVDMAKFYGYATLDIVADLTFGESFYGLEADNEHSWILGFFLGAKFGTVRNSLSRYYPIDRIFGWLFLRLTAKNRARSWQIATAKIHRRLDMGDLGAERSDFITPVVGKVDTGKKVSITMRQLTTNSLAIVIAGCQLSTVAMATCTYLLCRYPDTLEELTHEIRSTFKSDAEITVASTQKLTYLTAVVKEALRIHHPTPVNMPRVVLPGGQVVDGHWIPGGTVIGVNLQTVHNSPRNWVEPDVFHPERFLPESDHRHNPRFLKDDKAAFQPFAIGPRNCMGGKYVTVPLHDCSQVFDHPILIVARNPNAHADVYCHSSRVFLAEAHLIISKMVYNFDMALADPNDVDWMDQKAYLFFEPKKLMVKLVERTTEA
ncbi:MAG: hypothetical protein Q9188_002427 [Gyalolechia gomerana]